MRESLWPTYEEGFKQNLMLNSKMPMKLTRVQGFMHGDKVAFEDYSERQPLRSQSDMAFSNTRELKKLDS